MIMYRIQNAPRNITRRIIKAHVQNVDGMVYIAIVLYIMVVRFVVPFADGLSSRMYGRKGVTCE